LSREFWSYSTEAYQISTICRGIVAAVNASIGVAVLQFVVSGGMPAQKLKMGYVKFRYSPQKLPGYGCNFKTIASSVRKFAAYVARILLCESCEFGEKIYYSN